MAAPWGNMLQYSYKKCLCAAIIPITADNHAPVVRTGRDVRFYI